MTKRIWTVVGILAVFFVGFFMGAAMYKQDYYDEGLQSGQQTANRDKDMRFAEDVADAFSHFNTSFNGEKMTGAEYISFAGVQRFVIRTESGKHLAVVDGRMIDIGMGK